MKYISEMNKLAHMLAVTCIPYEVVKQTMYGTFKICYPAEVGCICDVVCNPASYGHQDGLLEIMGLLTPDERKMDSVIGWLDADEVFARISRDWFSDED